MFVLQSLCNDGGLTQPPIEKVNNFLETINKQVLVDN